MKEEKVVQLVRQIVKEEIENSKREKSDFRRWNPQDSVTDKFSPITGASQMIAFFGSNRISKPTVTGSKGANAALTSLLTALSNLGLITDSTS